MIAWLTVFSRAVPSEACPQPLGEEAHRSWRLQSSGGEEAAGEAGQEAPCGGGGAGAPTAIQVSPSAQEDPGGSGGELSDHPVTNALLWTVLILIDMDASFSIWRSSVFPLIYSIYLALLILL